MECKNQLVYVNKMAASVDEDDEQEATMLINQMIENIKKYHKGYGAKTKDKAIGKLIPQIT